VEVQLSEFQKLIVPQFLSGEIIRVVESQEQIATLQLVDNFDEQLLLEEMIDNSKPPLSASTSGLHYLLSTPFRYPPLKHGSRFGTKNSPGLFYASNTIAMAFTETAFYRFMFIHALKEVFPKKSVTQHTAFTAKYRTNKGLKLHGDKFISYQQQLREAEDYSFTQELGALLRDNNIEAFEFFSARTKKDEINTALFSPKCFSVSSPTRQTQWICETTSEQVSYYSSESNQIYCFKLESFYKDGQLPFV